MDKNQGDVCSNNSIDDSQEEKINNSNNGNEKKLKESKNKNKISSGSNDLHFLPCKLFFEKSILKKNIDDNFEKNIKYLKDKQLFNVKFRGRNLDGKEIKLGEKQGINVSYLSLAKEPNEYSKYEIQNIRNLDNYIVWRYDEIIKSDNPIINLPKIFRLYFFR